MELGARWHCVDHDRLLVCVVIEEHHLQPLTGPVCADDQISALARDDSGGMANGVQHVFVADAVLSCAVRDFPLDKVALSVSAVKAASSTAPRSQRWFVRTPPAVDPGAPSGRLGVFAGRWVCVPRY
jgi:hypothetical protein